MTYIEKTVETAIDINEYGQPYVNPYNGCTVGCPFCYWLSIPGWEGNMDIRVNIAQRLEEFCREHQAEKPRLYMGSYCDPYMEIEAERRLTRACLEVIAAYGFPLTLCTSARSDLVLRDLDLFRRMEGLIVAAELCRLDQTERLERGEAHLGVQAANALHDAGIRVFATFAPIMPGVTDLDKVRRALRPEIPVYIDTMYVQPGTIQARKLLAEVEALRPELLDQYRDYIDGKHPEWDRETLARAGVDNLRLFPMEE